MSEARPTHPIGFDWTRLQQVTADDPLRVLFSACLLGHATGWEGGAYTDALAVRLARLPTVRSVHFCPENATLGTPRIYEGFRGGKGRAFLHGHTFAGNPLGARVASEVIAIFREEGVLEGIPERAALIEKAFRTLPGVSAPRALGMVGAAELTAAEGGGADEVAAGYLGELGRAVTDCARQKGAYLRPVGDTVYVTPPNMS